MLLPSLKSDLILQAKLLRLAIVLNLILGSTVGSVVTFGQAKAHEISFPVTIEWNKQKGIARYRLQIAGDEKFQNIFFDARVMGTRSVLSNLSPGHYYWRVAPAESQLGNFSRPAKLFVSGGVVTTVRLPARAAGARSMPLLTTRK